ncbi:MAG TPA: LysM-like peptidoglycan-binding domain-containing protein, partial [Oligoflexia bacterium]|nr:LysM-like peptidoglycan-binding domain-containing protein [Oligoflexia bacterium]
MNRQRQTRRKDNRSGRASSHARAPRLKKRSLSSQPVNGTIKSVLSRVTSGSLREKGTRHDLIGVIRGFFLYLLARRAEAITLFGVLLIISLILYGLLPWDRVRNFWDKALWEGARWESELKGLSHDQDDGIVFRFAPSFNDPMLEMPSFAQIIRNQGRMDEGRVLDGHLLEGGSARFQIRSGDSLRNVLLRHGINSEEALSASNALSEAGGKDTGSSLNLKAGDDVQVLFDETGGLLKVKFAISGGQRGVLERADDGSFQFSRTEVEKMTRERMVVGSITTSFAAAARRSGLSYDTIDELVDIFSDRVSFHRDFRKGDRFTLIYHEHEIVGSREVRSGPILAAALEVKGEHFVAVRYVGIDG